MNKKILIVSICIILFIIVVYIIFNFTSKENTNLNNIAYNANNSNIQSENKESEEIMNANVKAIIDSKEYKIKLEDNKTAKEFVKLLPQEFKMTELNGNEKYIYLDTTLPTDSYKPNHIETGDIMLFGDNCLVVFYKSFDTSYSYTKIGHIDNFPDLSDDNINIKFEK